MLIGSYSPSLVVISLFVAVLASYTALDLSGLEVVPVLLAVLGHSPHLSTVHHTRARCHSLDPTDRARAPG